MLVKTDILIAGAGAAGLTTGIALAQAGYDVHVVGKLDTARTGRTVALFEASLRLMRALELWPRLAPLATPIERIRLVDDTGALFAPAPLLLRASEIGLDAFGQNIGNAELVTALAAEARRTAGLTLHEDFLGDYSLSGERARAKAATGLEFEARLIVGADGRGSPARAAAGIGTHEWSYPQTALTAFVWHERPHRFTSTEFHTRNGPCTLVPLAGDGAHAHRSSLVWLMAPDAAERRLGLPDAALAEELEQQLRALHGKMGMAGPRCAFPMGGLRCDRLTSTRLALVADAGHAFPPIGAQGLNLGLRDIAQLVASLARHGRADPGAPQALAHYERARAADVFIRTAGVSAMNASLLIDNEAMDLMRAGGVAAMRHIAPLRRALMWEGVAPPLRLPPLMRERRRERSEHART